MRRLVLPLLMLLAAAPPARAGRRQATLSLPAGARVQAEALSDGLSVGVFVRGMAPAELRAALAALAPEATEVMAPGPGQAAAMLRFATPVKSAAASLAGGRARGAKHTLAVHLDVEVEDVREAVLEHALARPLPLPASLELGELGQADQLLVSGKVAQAQLLLERLRGGYTLHAWVLLRLGDVAVYDRDVAQACRDYSEAKGDGLERTASMLAQLRARVLHCPDVAPPPWERLLGRDGIDDPVGQRIADEARWALRFETEVETLREVLRLEGPRYAHTISRSLRAALLARGLRLASPFVRAGWAMSQPQLLHGHPEAFDLDLSLAQAWCTLDSPGAWHPGASAASSWMTLKRADREAWQARAGHCQLEHPAPAPPKAAAHPPEAVEAHLRAIAQRLGAAEAALDRLQPGGARAWARAPAAAPAPAASGTATAADPNKEAR